MTPKQPKVEDPNDVTPEPPIKAEAPKFEPLRHVLDDAPPMSKIVRTLDGAWLATTEGTSALGATDLFRKLPPGAKITKTGPESFVAVQLNPAISHPDLHTKSAMDAILRFVPYFHGGEAVK
jgi:hypothetical protein